MPLIVFRNAFLLERTFNRISCATHQVWQGATPNVFAELDEFLGSGSSSSSDEGEGVAADTAKEEGQIRIVDCALGSR